MLPIFVKLTSGKEHVLLNAINIVQIDSEKKNSEGDPWPRNPGWPADKTRIHTADNDCLYVDETAEQIVERIEVETQKTIRYACIQIGRYFVEGKTLAR